VAEVYAPFGGGCLGGGGNCGLVAATVGIWDCGNAIILSTRPEKTQLEINYWLHGPELDNWSVRGFLWIIL
jgi:hypothetical protein